MIVKTTTTDGEGKVYKKVFSNFKQGAINCDGKNNEKFEVKPNFSIRKGDGKFGEEVVLQLTKTKVLEKYSASTSTKHIETYFKINGETLEFFEEFVKMLREELNGIQK